MVNATRYSVHSKYKAVLSCRIGVIVYVENNLMVGFWKRFVHLRTERSQVDTEEPLLLAFLGPASQKSQNFAGAFRVT